MQFYLGNIIYSYYVKGYLFYFFNSFTLSAYLKVFKVFSLALDAGEIFPIITVLQFPMNESLKTSVNLDPLNGV